MRSITIDTKIDLAGLEKDLKRATRDIERFKSDLERKKVKRESLVSDMDAKDSEYVAAMQKLEKLKAMSADEQKELLLTGGNHPQMVKEQAAYAEKLYKEYDRAATAVEKMDAKVRDASNNLAIAETKAREASTEIAANTRETMLWDKASERVGKSLKSIKKRIIGLAKRALLFSLILRGFHAIKNYFAEMIKQNDAASQSVGRLKGALQTLAQPIFNAVIPAFIAIINWITRVINAITRLIALLSGKSMQDWQKQASGLDKNKGGKTNKPLANFDTINKLDAGGGSPEDKMEAIYDQAEMTNEEMWGLLGTIGAIGAAFALWEIPIEGLTSFEKFAGILMFIGGSALAIKNYIDAWNNGINTDNLLGTIGGVAIALLGLYFLFGATGAAIGLFVAGIALLVLGFHDMEKNGANLHNTLTVIAGVLAIGLGIAILTGSWIPLLVAAIIDIVLLLVQLGGEGDNLFAAFKKIFGGITKFLQGVFTGDWKKAWEGIKDIVSGVWDAIKAIFLGVFKAIGIDASKQVEALETIFGGVIKFFQGVFTGDWKKAWEGIKDIFKGIWNGMIDIIGIFVNACIKGLNWLIDKINSISFDVPDWVPGIGGERVGFNLAHVPQWTDIPYLAQGAVIPPNREFLAVLGDQKSGTNIETPLETMIEAFKAAQAGQNPTVKIYFTGSLAQLANVLAPAVKYEFERTGEPLIL